MTLLSVRSVAKSFPTGRRRAPFRAVHDVSFELEAGRTVAVVGESGAGKSTLGRLVARLVDADDGSILLDGTELTELRNKDLVPIRRTIQMIFQDPYNSLDPTYSIGRSVAEPLKIHFGTNRSDRERQAVSLLERVGLSAYHAVRRPKQLSGGQLQRVAIARALAVEPKLMVCDEPVAALDVSIRAEVLNLLRELRETAGLAYIFITHDLSTVRVVADDLLVMRAGEVVEHGSCEQVFAAPSSEYTRELLDAIPRFGARSTPAPSAPARDAEMV